jgi:hypothetical protein
MCGCGQVFYAIEMLFSSLPAKIMLLGRFFISAVVHSAEKLLLCCAGGLLICFIMIRLDIVQHSANIFVNKQLQQYGWRAQIGKISGAFPLSFNVRDVVLEGGGDGEAQRVHINNIKVALNWKTFKFSLTIDEMMANSGELGTDGVTPFELQQITGTGPKALSARGPNTPSIPKSNTSLAPSPRVAFAEPILSAAQKIISNIVPVMIHLSNQYLEMKATKKKRQEKKETIWISLLSVLNIKKLQINGICGTTTVDLRKKRNGALIQLHLQKEHASFSFQATDIKNHNSTIGAIEIPFAAEYSQTPLVCNKQTPNFQGVEQLENPEKRGALLHKNEVTGMVASATGVLVADGKKTAARVLLTNNKIEFCKQCEAELLIDNLGLINLFTTHTMPLPAAVITATIKTQMANTNTNTKSNFIINGVFLADKSMNINIKSISKNQANERHDGMGKLCNFGKLGDSGHDGNNSRRDGNNSRRDGNNSHDLINAKIIFFENKACFKINYCDKIASTENKKIYPITKRIDGRSLGACRVPAKSQTLWDAAQVPSRTSGTAQAEHRSNEPTNFLRSGIYDAKNVKPTKQKNNVEVVGVAHDASNSKSITIEKFFGSCGNIAFDLKQACQIDLQQKNFSPIVLSLGKHVLSISGGQLNNENTTFSLSPIILFLQEANDILYFGTYSISGSLYLNKLQASIAIKSHFDKQQIRTWQKKNNVQNVDLLVNGEIQFDKKVVLLHANINTENINAPKKHHIRLSKSPEPDTSLHDDSSAFAISKSPKTLAIDLKLSPLSGKVFDVFGALVDLYERSIARAPDIGNGTANQKISATIRNDDAAIDNAGTANAPSVASSTTSEVKPSRFVSVDGSIKGQFSLAPLVVFLGSNDILEGVLSASVSVSGGLRKPNFSGSIKMANGHYENVNNGVVLKNVSLDASGFKSGLKVNAMRFTDGTTIGTRSIAMHGAYSPSAPPEGTASAFGYIWFFSEDLCVAPRFDLKLKCNFFQGTYIDVVKARATGTLDLVGPLTGLSARPIVTGRAILDPVFIDTTAAQISEPTNNNIKINWKHGANQSKKKQKIQIANPNRFKIKIALVAGREVLVSGDNELQCFLKGELFAEGPLRAPYLVGELEIDPQRINSYNLLGRILNAQTGTVSYKPTPVNDPAVKVTMHTKINQTDIFIDVFGYTSNIEIGLRSTPSLSKERILSLLLFKQDADELSLAKRKHVKAFASQMLQDNPLGVVDKLRNAVGLDSLEVVEQQDLASGETVQSVRIGKQIKNVRLFVDKSFASNAGGKMTVRYDITPQVGLEANVSTEKKDSGVGIQWQKRY